MDRLLNMFIGVADRADDYDLQRPVVVSAIRLQRLVILKFRDRY